MRLGVHYGVAGILTISVNCHRRVAEVLRLAPVFHRLNLSYDSQCDFFGGFAAQA